MSARNTRKKNQEVTISPSSLIGLPLPRVAIVRYESGHSTKYYLAHIPSDDVVDFWNMEDSKKLQYLNAKFNWHHRRPRIQGGKRGSNLVKVDIESHREYNNLISLVSKHARLGVEKVRPVHVQHFLKQIYPVVKRLLIDPDTGNLNSLEILERIFNQIWLPEDESISLKEDKK